MTDAERARELADRLLQFNRWTLDEAAALVLAELRKEREESDNEWYGAAIDALGLNDGLKVRRLVVKRRATPEAPIAGRPA